MAHYLGQLLQVDTPLFAIGMQKLEQATGNTGIDTKLIGDIHEKAYAVMRKLGLDPQNTTNRELWTALHGEYPKNTLQGSEYAGLVTVDGVVSFNKNDVSRNKNRAFGERTTEALQQALVKEITERYLATGRETMPHVEQLLKESGITTMNLQHRQKGRE